MSAGQRKVTVLGLGLMGAAIANVLVDAGESVTVWNRTPERASQFQDRATVAATAAEACGESDLVIVSLLDPGACRSVLRSPEVEAALRGKDVIQLTTTTPADAIDEAEWATTLEARYLGGAILSAPSMVGTSSARIFVSGSGALFYGAKSILAILTPNVTYLGDGYGRAATMDHALLELSYGCLAMLFHAMALCEAGAVPLDQFRAQVGLFRDGFLEQRAGAVGTGTYPVAEATMDTFDAWAKQLVATSRSARIDTALPEALSRSIERTVQMGYGGGDYQTMFEAFRARVVSPASDVGQS